MPFIFGHWWVLIIVLVIVLIIWGPGKLPNLGSGLGRAIREFRKESSAEPGESKPASPKADPAAPGEKKP